MTHLLANVHLIPTKGSPVPAYLLKFCELTGVKPADVVAYSLNGQHHIRSALTRTHYYFVNPDLSTYVRENR